MVLETKPVVIKFFGGIPMSYLRKIQYHILAAILAAAMLFPIFSNQNETQNVLSWWGTIYPQFCFMEIPEEDNLQESKPRFQFWIAETIKDLL